MSKYIGVLSIIFAIIFAWYLENKIARNNFIIQDHYNGELEILDNYLRQESNYKKYKEPIKTPMDKLLDDVKLSDSYSKEVRELILDKFDGEVSNSENKSNISLYTMLYKQMRKEKEQVNKREEVLLVIDDVIQLKSDSVSLSIVPVSYLNYADYTIDFKYKNKKISKEKLLDFNGELKYLSAEILNPRTKEISTFKGE